MTSYHCCVLISREEIILRQTIFISLIFTIIINKSQSERRLIISRKDRRSFCEKKAFSVFVHNKYLSRVIISIVVIIKK